MASTPSQNNAFELMTTGEKSGQWGDITNTNMDIIDRATKGVGTITLTTTSYSLDTVDYSVSEGHYAVLVFSGTPGGTCTVTINPSDQQKVFIVRNTTPSSVVLTQGSGGNVTVPTGKSAVVYADGAGSGAAVVDVTASLNLAAAGALLSANDLSDVASASTARTNLGLAIGANVLAYDSNLQSFVSTFTLPTSDSPNGYVLSTNGSGTLQLSPTGSGDGSVTSVAVSGGTTGLTTSGGPVTTAGTITLAGTLNVANGGTGSATASGARTSLGLAIGSDVQAYDAGLQSIAGLTTSANQLIYTTGSNTYATSSLTSFARTLLDDADAATARATLGVAIGTNVLAFDSNLQSFVTAFTLPTSDGSADQVLQTNGSGTLSFSNVGVVSGGTALGSGTMVSPSGAFNNVAIGTNALNGLTSGDDNVAVGVAAGDNVFAGSRNTFLGSTAGREVGNGSDNVLLGYAAGSTISGGIRNVAVGANAGSTGEFASLGDNNITLGYSANTSNRTGDNNVVIGTDAEPSTTTISNEITLGNSSHTVLRLPFTVTVTNLPSASTVGAGARSFVTDATATTFASIVAGGGANGVPVYSDGTNWRIG